VPGPSITICREGQQVAIQRTPRRFTAAEYWQMVEAHVFDADERLELIDGEIVQMSPIGDPHAAGVVRLTMLLTRLFAERALVSAQNALKVGERYVPQPDLMVLRPRADFYATQTPVPADCLLVIEVSDTTADFDCRIKAPRYAAGGVAELWQLDLPRDAVVVYREPVGEAYQAVRVYQRGETVTIAALGEPAIAVEAILGPIVAPPSNT
jgi:Uma2 family endonuclease